ncbi:MAG: FAD-binding oxidoreductase [Pseudolabrys sp.]
MPQVTLIFSDGERKRFEAPSDKPILAAAKSAGIALASDCEIGDCQTCKAHLKSGSVEFDELAFITLDDDEIEGGAVLTCVSMAQEDVEIELPYVRGHLIPEKKYAMKVTAVETLSPTTARLRGELPRNATFAFHPGQYVNIHVPGSGALRSYSMASDPAQPNNLEFHIRLLPDGQMSNFMRRGDIVGSSVDIAGPKGVFYLREGDDPVVMIAGGTGLAPMVSMLQAIARSDRTKLPILLCFGVNRPDDLYGIEQLESLRQQLPNLDLRMAMVEPNGKWNGHKGFVTDLVKNSDVSDDSRVYLCGPPPMIAAARKRVAEFGVPDGAVFAEEFIPSGTATA